jgi:hypothetical protein
MNNVLRKRLIIRKMKRRIKSVKRREIKLNDININRSNIRSTVDYDSSQMRELIESMKAEGFKLGREILIYHQ